MLGNLIVSAMLCTIMFSLASAETLQVTEEHPFLLNGSWVLASELKTGDVLGTADGGQVRIKSVTRVETSGPFPVYNLEAGVYHDFVAGILKLVVHNSNSPGTTEEVLEDATKNAEDAKGAKSLSEMSEDSVRAVEKAAEPLGKSPIVLTSVDGISETELAVIKARAAKLQFKNTPLVAVHATSYFPEGGVIRPGGQSHDLAGRETIHFSLNGVATAGFIGSTDEWATMGYYIVSPLDDLNAINKPIGGCTVDVFFAGQVQLPSTAKVFASKGALESYINKISEVRGVGNRGWDMDPSGFEAGLFFEENGWFAGLHSDHWTHSYERLRYHQVTKKAGITHSEAVKQIIMNDARRTRWALLSDNPPLPERVASERRSWQALRREMRLFNYEIPTITESDFLSSYGYSEVSHEWAWVTKEYEPDALKELVEIANNGIL